tara:strand:- start:789 stop:1022 length:234 start_codon:yes stop_codon:yes gene_type:complete
MTKRKRKEQERERSISIQKRQELINKACYNKVRYATEVEAWSAGKYASSYAFNDQKTLRPYPCRHCNGFHLTKQPRD